LIVVAANGFLFLFFRPTDSEKMVQEKCNARNQKEGVRVLEQLLFKTASSKEEYLNLSTIEERIKGVSVRLLSRCLKQKQRRLTAASHVFALSSCTASRESAFVFLRAA
jgi:hypothetical protein